jgi:hypothetical protein
MNREYPEGFWPVSEQEFKCMMAHHGSNWEDAAAKAEVFFYIYDAWKDEEPVNIEYRPFFADDLTVTYTPAKYPGFVGPMPQVTLKEGRSYVPVEKRSFFDNLDKIEKSKSPSGNFKIMTISELYEAVRLAGNMDEFTHLMRAEGFDSIGLLPDDWSERNNRDETIPGAIQHLSGPVMAIESVHGHHSQLLLDKIKRLHETFVDAGKVILDSCHDFKFPNQPLYPRGVAVFSEEEQKDVKPKNRPKGPRRTKNQRGKWWNR